VLFDKIRAKPRACHSCSLNVCLAFVNKSLSEPFRPAIVLARRKAYAYDPLAVYKYNAESMPTLHQYGIKNQQPIVLKTLLNGYLCLLMSH
jgi:hypothetical protein